MVFSKGSYPVPQGIMSYLPCHGSPVKSEIGETFWVRINGAQNTCDGPSFSLVKKMNAMAWASAEQIPRGALRKIGHLPGSEVPQIADQRRRLLQGDLLVSIDQGIHECQIKFNAKALVVVAGEIAPETT